MPLGCLEKHGQHLPVGCTEAIAKAMVKISAERLARIFKMLKEDGDVLKMVKDSIPS